MVVLKGTVKHPRVVRALFVPEVDYELSCLVSMPEQIRNGKTAGMVAHAFNPPTWASEAGRSM